MSEPGIPTRCISDKFSIIRDLCRFLQPGLISSTTFLKKLDFPTANYKRYINLFIISLTPNDWKHLLTTKTSKKSLLKKFCYNNKVTRTVKNFKKLSNKDIFTSQPSIYLIHIFFYKKIFYKKMSLKTPQNL